MDTVQLNADHEKLVSALVETYRTLNGTARHLTNETAGQVHQTVDRMKNDEMHFAQALKERVTGVPYADSSSGDAPVLGTESEENTVTMLVSQFGTARATTLSMLKALESSKWSDDAGDGRSILDHVRDLVESDRVQLERVRQALSA